MGKLEGTEELAFGVFQPNSGCCFSNWEALSSVQGILKLLLAFLGKKPSLFQD
jgi:hypothetical protein